MTGSVHSLVRFIVDGEHEEWSRVCSEMPRKDEVVVRSGIGYLVKQVVWADGGRTAVGAQQQVNMTFISPTVVLRRLGDDHDHFSEDPPPADSDRQAVAAADRPPGD